jgi:hypothetical protein
MTAEELYNVELSTRAHGRRQLLHDIQQHQLCLNKDETKTDRENQVEERTNQPVCE